MKNRRTSSLSWSPCVPVCLRAGSANDHEPATAEMGKQAQLPGPRETGGLKAISFVLANETFERLAFFGLFANFAVYMTRVFHMDQVSGAYIMNAWSGVTNFLPLAGAFLADSYIGRFWTIGAASFFSFSGMFIVTLTSGLPQLHPPQCPVEQQHSNQCIGASQSQVGVLILGLFLISIGSGGIRPCSIPFGVDQFDSTSEKGRKGIASYYNWYYTTFTFVIIIALTVLIYIQERNWVIGLAIPTSLMAFSIILFFSASKFFNHAKIEGSAFTSIAQVFVAAIKKRHIKTATNDKGAVLEFYDPPMVENVVAKLPRTEQYRFLDKAAVITSDEDLTPNGTPSNKWRLCSVQSVEEFKCLIRVIPIWFCGMISLTAMTQQWTFTIYQAIIMDRHMGPHFILPPGTISIISLLTIVIFIPLYDRVIVPALRRITGREDGFTLLQRIGVGMVFAVFSMVAAGVVEEKRRRAAVSGAPPISAFWLAPQLVLLGFCEAFNIIGQIEFFNRQFPDNMRSVGNALLPCSFGGASYASVALIAIVHSATGSKDRPRGWLAADLNEGRYDLFYFVVAGLGVVNLVMFLLCAKWYKYKGSGTNDDDRNVDVEMSNNKGLI